MTRIWLSESAAWSINQKAEAAYPSETGGILAGVRVGRRPWVTHAIEIMSRRRGHTHYQLPQNATVQAIKALRGTDSRIGYLGDWHSHVLDLGLSIEDQTSMRRLVGDPRAMCRYPLLLIARKTANGNVFDITEWSSHGFRRPQVTMAGDLRPPCHAEGSSALRRWIRVLRS